MIIYCLGMQSSGSTWIYNVVRELFAAAKRPCSVYRVEVFEHFYDERAFGMHDAVLRGHNVESALLRMFSLAGIKAVLSFRDPRDAVTSFLQRFHDHGATFQSSCNDVARNLASLISASQSIPHLSFFYEDLFTEKLDSVRALAEYLGVTVDVGAQQRIFEKYHATSVKAFISNLNRLAPDRLFLDETANLMDRETSFHRTHISDMRIGKWQDILDVAQRKSVKDLFDGYASLLEKRDFRTVHNSNGPSWWVKVPCPFSVTFTSALFAVLDTTQKPARPLTTNALVSSLGVKILQMIFIPIGRWSFRLVLPDLAVYNALICQNGEVLVRSETEHNDISLEIDNKLHDHPFDVHITYYRMAEDVDADLPAPYASLEARFVGAVVP